MFLILGNVDLQYRTNLLKPHNGIDFSSELIIPCNLSVWTFRKIKFLVNSNERRINNKLNYETKKESGEIMVLVLLLYTLVMHV